MLRWFVDTLQRLIEAALGLAVALVAGLVRAPRTAAARAVAPIEIRIGHAREVIDVRHRVLREGRPRDTAIFPGDEAPDTTHWVAVQADRVVGVVTVMHAPLPDPPAAVDPVPAWQLRGMAVLPELRGEGLGVRLLHATHALERPLWCNARAHVVAFYERHGWRVVGPVFEIKGVGPHRRMIWSPGAGPA